MRNNLSKGQFGGGEPEQLKMFMSANEILERWGPLEGDRQDSGDYDFDDFGDLTRSPGTHAITERTPFEHHTMRTTGGSRLYRRVSGGTESDENLWNRKYAEAEATGLADAINEEGVRMPVSLGRTKNVNGDLEVVGGHHRLAVMMNDAPDELMPVLHFSSFHEAIDHGAKARMGKGGFKYT